MKYIVLILISLSFIVSGCCSSKSTGINNSDIERIESQDHYVPWWI